LPQEQKPTLGVLGYASPVKENKVFATNIKQWGQIDGNNIASEFNLDSFSFLNDFEAAAYGISCLDSDDYSIIGNKQEVDPHFIDNKNVQVVSGPGTGFGFAILTRADAKSRYQVYPSEGGHMDFAVRSDED